MTVLAHREPSFENLFDPVDALTWRHPTKRKGHAPREYGGGFIGWTEK
ncbi:MAG TPA: hypothetical protein VM685_11475 [Phenylobacterium sp.]|nr:hypothetical protein [Phenylobacterium sp.]